MEIFHEFVYYIFDSILIPLIRTNFYVTESQTHRNRLFYFRQDMWQQLTEQPFADLKASMFEELPKDRAKAVVAQSSLGFGALRLLPKATGLRPILNLRKRCLKPTIWGGKRSYYAPSINSSIGPIYNMLTYERQRAPSKMGSSLHSMGDMYHRLWNFKRQLAQRQSGQGKGAQSKIPPLFFVKLDIQACFDTIPQKELVQLVETLVSEKSYHITRHVEIRPSDLPTNKWKTSRKYAGRAAPAMQPQSLPDLITSGVQGRSENAVFVDTVNQKAHGAEDLLDLLDEHVRNNLVKMGNKYFRQRNGIPQGSVLSSLLCNFFYAEFEREVLGFLRREDALLLRLIDDFLLITPDAGLAVRFAQVMIPGQPSYGVSVNAAKSLVNFTAAVNGIHIPRLEGSSLFPYCGCLIDTHTLEIHRDHDRMLEPGDSAAATISNTLTVEAARLPGHAFRRKVLSAYRLQMHPMYLDDIHNSRTVVLVNLYTSLVASAMKTYSHMKSLRGRAHPSAPVIIRTIHDLILQTARMIQARSAATNSSSSSVSFSCFVARRHIQYLTAAAFRFVLLRKQTRYATVLRWLDRLAKQARPTADAEALRMAQAVRKGNVVFDEWRF
jgi:telomerase reverse transcriptase